MTLLINTESEDFTKTVVISHRPTVILVKLELASSSAEVKKMMKSGKVYHAKSSFRPIFWPVVRDHKLDISDGDIIQYDGKQVQINFTSFKIEVDTVEI